MGFDCMFGELFEYEELESVNYDFVVWEFLGWYFMDLLLIEMIFCLVMWYGNVCENDMEFG